MQSYQPRTRLYVPLKRLKAGDIVTLPEAQAHYLRHVLRAQVGQRVEVFNGKDGAFAAAIAEITKQAVRLTLEERAAPQETLPKLTLAFALLKKERTQMVVEKATELGVAKLIPLVTERTQGQAVKQWKADKALAYAIEACEQCGRTALPDIGEPQDLPALVEDLEGSSVAVFYADEMLAGQSQPVRSIDPARWTIVMIGPEGGWSSPERQLLERSKFCQPLSLGPRILRAETAAIAAIARLLA